MVEPVLDMIERDKLEVSVPEWFAERLRGKYRTSARFLNGTIEFARTQSG